MTTGAISRAKLQSNHHHQQTNIQFSLQAGCPSCRPTNSVKVSQSALPYLNLPFEAGVLPPSTETAIQQVFRILSLSPSLSARLSVTKPSSFAKSRSI